MRYAEIIAEKSLGMPHAVSVAILTNATVNHYNLKGDQVEDFARSGRIDPTTALVR